MSWTTVAAKNHRSWKRPQTKIVINHEVGPTTTQRLAGKPPHSCSCWGGPSSHAMRRNPNGSHLFTMTEMVTIGVSKIRYVTITNVTVSDDGRTIEGNAAVGGVSCRALITNYRVDRRSQLTGTLVLTF